MSDQSENKKTVERLAEPYQYQSDDHDNVGKKVLMVDKNGFVREIGDDSWRPYDPQNDQ